MQATKHRFYYSYSTQGGEISRYGTIRVLYKHVVEPRADKEAGAMYWSADFHKYSGKGCKVKFTNDGNVLIIDRRGKPMKSVPQERIYYASWEIRIKKVGPSGYIGWDSESASEEETRRYNEAFLAVSRGEKPAVLCDSPYIKVPRRFIGQELVVIDLSCSKHVVFNKNGKRILCKTKFPLASRRWSDHIAASSEVLKKVKLVKKFSIADERWGRLREVTSWATEAASFYEQFVEHVPEEYRYLHCDSFIRAKIGAEGCAANNHPPNALIVLSGGLNIGKVLCTMCERTLLPTQLFNFS